MAFSINLTLNPMRTPEKNRPQIPCYLVPPATEQQRASNEPSISDLWKNQIPNIEQVLNRKPTRFFAD